jgi:hypothetical protein
MGMVHLLPGHLHSFFTHLNEKRTEAKQGKTCKDYMGRKMAGTLKNFLETLPSHYMYGMKLKSFFYLLFCY